MAVIFLDYDGVMHPYPCDKADLFMQAPLFEKTMSDFPGFEIVISSDWRMYAENHDDLIQHFSEPFRSRIIGSTGQDGIPGSDCAREREVYQWLQKNGREHETWIAIDDWTTNFATLPGKGHVLYCDPSQGFDERAARLLKQMLAGKTEYVMYAYDR